MNEYLDEIFPFKQKDTPVRIEISDELVVVSNMSMRETMALDCSISDWIEKLRETLLIGKQLVIIAPFAIEIIDNRKK